MKLRTTYCDGRPTLLVQFADEEPSSYCGDSWCNGVCGLPALVVPGTPEMKAHSSMVAHGPVMQAWRVTWTGAKVEAPPEHHADLLKRYWT